MLSHSMFAMAIAKKINGAQLAEVQPHFQLLPQRYAINWLLQQRQPLLQSGFIAFGEAGTTYGCALIPCAFRPRYCPSHECGPRHSLRD